MGDHTKKTAFGGRRSAAFMLLMLAVLLVSAGPASAHYRRAAGAMITSPANGAVIPSDGGNINILSEWLCYGTETVYAHERIYKYSTTTNVWDNMIEIYRQGNIIFPESYNCNPDAPDPWVDYLFGAVPWNPPDVYDTTVYVGIRVREFTWGADNPTHTITSINQITLTTDSDHDGYYRPADCVDTNNYIHPGATEVCNGIDDNCVGGVDEGCDDDNDNYCQSGKTIVGTPSTCTAGGGDCIDTNNLVNPSAAEICDNLDNDCDGSTDEGCDDDNDNYCKSGMTFIGIPSTCTAGGNDCNDADPAINPGVAEVCDGIENDCAAPMDGGCVCINGDTRSCGSDTGECTAGIQTCSIDSGQWGDCVGAVWPALEVCDNLDNDCDGQRDEELTTSCYTGPAGTLDVGVCRSGTKSCTGGVWGVCSGDVLPSSDVCDMIDNDCDVSTADGSGETASLNTNQIGVCAGSRQSCAAGLWGDYYSNIAGYEPINEVSCADSIDNDCDGLADCDDIDCRDSPSCPCILKTAYWSHSSVSDGSPVDMLIRGEHCWADDSVIIDVWENDLRLPFESIFGFVDLAIGNDNVTYRKEAAGFTQIDGMEVFFDDAGMATMPWQALYNTYMINGASVEYGRPEYYYTASLADGTGASSGLLYVNGNRFPVSEVDLLTSPNSGVYEQSVSIEWNPVTDPDDDVILYDISYSDNAGNSWYVLKEDYGYIYKLTSDEIDMDTASIDFSAGQTQFFSVRIPKEADISRADIGLILIDADSFTITIGGSAAPAYSGTGSGMAIADLASGMRAALDSCASLPGEDCMITLTMSAGSGSVIMRDIDIRYTDYDWDTSSVTEGTKYKVKITAKELKPVCGNSILEAGEQCDDSNLVPGDGCSVMCLSED